MRNVKFGKPMIGNEEREAVMDVLSDDILVHGPKATEFEKSFSKYVKGGKSVSVSSCTAALHLSYFHYEIGKGDEVIVPAQSHVATVHAVELAGATPVFVDAELETGNMDLDQIEEVITERTKAISVVHFLGMPVNMDRIKSVSEKYNLRVIEDCALSVGATYKGIHTGLFGDTGCFSFYPVKHFTTAEGGMVLCKNPDDADSISRKRAFGVDRVASERKIPGIYDVDRLGYNYRMNEIQAAIGIEQLKKVNSFINKREENYFHLMNGLNEIDEIELFKSTNGEYKSSYYCLSVILSDRLAGKRFDIVTELNNRGVGTSVYYPKAIPEFSYYQEKYGFKNGQFPNAARISNQSIAFPVGPHLDIDDMDYIVENLKQVLANY